MISTMTRYQMLQTNTALTKTLTQNDAMVKRDTDYYLANISKVRTIDDFVKDYRLFSYAMKAYGLEDMIYAKALIKKVLTEGITDTKSMANKMTDTRYKEFAAAFDFAAKVDKATSQASATTKAVNKYYEYTLEKKEGEQNEGVRIALYFKRKASSVTNTMGLLADKALLKFVQTTFNIPMGASKADLDLQVRNLEKHINIKDLQDPKKVDKLIQRFSAMYDMNNVSPATAAPVLTLFSEPTEVGVSVDLMMSISKLRLGGF
jgi:glucan-binding YG repeat protein